MKPEEIRKLTIEEIQAKLTDTQDELMKLRFRQVTGQLPDTSRLRILRRDIARLETIAKELANVPVEEGKKDLKEEPKARTRIRTRAKVKTEEGEV